MKIYIASDHRGVDVEKKLINTLKGLGYEVENLDLLHHPNDDYPDFAFALCNKVKINNNSLGVLLCGTGIGMSIAANKVEGIRAARCVSKEDAYFSRQHNAANVICLPNTIEISALLDIITTFVTTPLADEDRHINRVNKIINYESGTYNGL